MQTSASRALWLVARVCVFRAGLASPRLASSRLAAARRGSQWGRRGYSAKGEAAEKGRAEAAGTHYSSIIAMLAAGGWGWDISTVGVYVATNCRVNIHAIQLDPARRHPVEPAPRENGLCEILHLDFPAEAFTRLLLPGSFPTDCRILLHCTVALHFPRQRPESYGNRRQTIAREFDRFSQQTIAFINWIFVAWIRDDSSNHCV